MKSREIEKKAMLVVKERFLNLLTASCAGKWFDALRNPREF
jgi:hypothetical protein